ncbi:MAG TPA: dienelactone hydrolase family protein [Rhizomicrobium sp.]|nr:dienelactone hydrolase family protein [Rhizomicrobium sp.]
MVATSEVSLTVGGSPMDLLIAMPDGTGPHPAVLVAHHRGGVDEFTRDVAARFASIGLVAAVPNFYHRRPRSEDPVAAMKTLRDGDLVADMNATVDRLRKMDSVREDAIGIVGHCLGGRTAYLGLVTNPIYKCAVLLYHGNIFESRGDGMPAPIERTRNIHCPIIGFFGKEDTNPSPAAVARLAEALDRHKIRYEFHSYDGAGHAFQDFTSTTQYREAATKNAWEKMLAFLRRELFPQAPA